MAEGLSAVATKALPRAVAWAPWLGMRVPLAWAEQRAVKAMVRVPRPTSGRRRKLEAGIVFWGDQAGVADDTGMVMTMSPRAWCGRVKMTTSPPWSRRIL